MMKASSNLCVALTALFLAFSATANEIKLSPNNQTVRLIGSYSGITTDFVKIKEADTYEVRVLVQDRTGHTMTNKVALFSPVDGQLVQKNKDLYFQTADDEFLVAHHEWFYYPYWQVVKGVSLKTSVKQLNLSDYKVSVDFVL